MRIQNCKMGKKMWKVPEKHAQWKEKDAVRGLRLDNLDKNKAS